MVTHTKPKQTKLSDLKPDWVLIDAEGKTLGRLASEIATLLMGKHRSIYVRNLNTGDFVIVINANKIKVTGKKLEQKRYFNYSGYHGGIRERSLEDMLERWPTEAIKHAVKGMLPKNTPGRQMLSRLKLYAGSEHPHEAQLNAGAKLARAAQATAQVESNKRTTRENHPRKPPSPLPKTRHQILKWRMQRQPLRKKQARYQVIRPNRRWVPRRIGPRRPHLQRRRISN